MSKKKHPRSSTSFRCTFFEVISMGQKSTSFRRTLSHLISVSKKSTSFWRTFFDVISTGEKSTSFRCALFNVILMSKKSTTFPPNFDGQKNWRCFHVYFYVILILICFWMTRNSCRFDIYFWKCFDIPKTKAVWNSLLDVISFRFDFFKIILSHLEMY